MMIIGKAGKTLTARAHDGEEISREEGSPGALLALLRCLHVYSAVPEVGRVGM